LAILVLCGAWQAAESIRHGFFAQFSHVYVLVA
jgi:hypothetical protein